MLPVSCLYSPGQKIDSRAPDTSTARARLVNARQFCNPYIKQACVDNILLKSTHRRRRRWNHGIQPRLKSFRRRRIRKFCPSVASTFCHSVNNVFNVPSLVIVIVVGVPVRPSSLSNMYLFSPCIGIHVPSKKKRSCALIPYRVILSPFFTVSACTVFASSASVFGGFSDPVLRCGNDPCYSTT